MDTGWSPREVAVKKGLIQRMSPQEVGKKINELEQQMQQHAQDLEFEEAAKVRDQIHALREQLIEG